MAAIDKRVPGLRALREYRRELFGSDVVAGLSVAAVAVPIGIAYAQLAGFPPQTGLYSAIFPLIAYAFFGTSRQLIVNPDSAACAIVAATLAPLAAGDPLRYNDLSVTLALLVGVFCIAGGLLHLGVLANFLSRPILTGYMNGIALSILVGQIGPLFGFAVPGDGFFRKLAHFVLGLDQTHLLTFATGASVFVLLRALKHLAPRIPAPLVAVVVAIAAAFFFDFARRGVAVVGVVPSGLPLPRVPSSVAPNELGTLALDACGIVLVSFCSMMPTARGFAAKNGYRIDANQDFIALGMSNLASGLGQGFVVSGADSRTAVGVAAGGKTQVTSIVAAAAIAAVLMFLTGPLAYLPRAALAAIVISAVIGLFDLVPLIYYYRVSRAEFYMSIVATLGVITLGVLPGILITVGLALLRLVSLAANPHDAVLGIIDDPTGGYASDEPDARKIPGLTIYRYNASIVFFNADHLKDRVRALLAESSPSWLLIDAGPSPVLDVTGAEALDTLRGELAGRGIVLAIARPHGLFRTILDLSGVSERIGSERLFPTVREGVNAFVHEHGVTDGSRPNRHRHA
jgi:high affinity sulfate transporter 1